MTESATQPMSAPDEFSGRAGHDGASQSVVPLPKPTTDRAMDFRIGDSSEHWIGETPKWAHEHVRALRDPYIHNVISLDHRFGWQITDVTEGYVAHQGEAQFEVTLGGRVSLDLALAGFHAGTLSPLARHFDASEYGPEDEVDVVATCALPARAYATGIAWTIGDEIEVSDLNYMWEEQP